MRVLFVCTDADIGGAERLLALLGRHWRADDAVKLVVLMRPGSLSQELESAFDEVSYLGFPPTSRNLLGMVRALSREIREFAPDIVSSHLFHADLVTALARTNAPRVSTAHTHGLSADDHALTRLIARAVGALTFRFAAVIPSSDSNEMRKFLSSLGIRRIAPAILNGSELPPSPSFDSKARAFVSLARSHPVKGHATLLAAFRSIASELPEWTLRVIGPGVEAENEVIRSAIASADAEELVKSKRITLEGPTDAPQEALAGAAALVISSLYGETSPLVGAEAAGAGVPVITTRVGNCADFADDPRFVVEPGSANDLAQAMLIFASLSDGERMELSRLARARAERDYDPSRVAAAYRERFAAVIAEWNA